MPDRRGIITLQRIFHTSKTIFVLRLMYSSVFLYRDLFVQCINLIVSFVILSSLLFACMTWKKNPLMIRVRIDPPHYSFYAVIGPPHYSFYAVIGNYTGWFCFFRWNRKNRGLLSKKMCHDNGSNRRRAQKWLYVYILM